MINGFEIIDSHVHTFSSAYVAQKIISSFNKTYGIDFNNSGNGTIANVLTNMELGGMTIL